MPATEELLQESIIDEEEKAGLSPTNAHVGTSAPTASVATPGNGWAIVAAQSKPQSSHGSSAGHHRSPSSTKGGDVDWHEIPEATLTPELRRDLILLENRAHLDPKRFYKSSGTGRKRGELPTRVHVGTVVEAPHEFFSGRLTNRERRKSFADEVFSDGRLMENAKRRFTKVQESRRGKKRVVDPAARAIRKRRQHRSGGGDAGDNW